MKNPVAIKQPNLKSPIGVYKGKGKGKGKRKRKRNSGNLPYLRFRRKLRRDMF